MGTTLEKPTTRTKLWLEAVYEGGVFRPDAPPDLPEGAVVRIRVVAPPAPSGAEQQPSGFGAWKGNVDAEEFKAYNARQRASTRADD